MLGSIYPQLAPIYVKADQQDQFGLTNTATQGTITKEHLANRPLLRPAEVLETILELSLTSIVVMVKQTNTFYGVLT
ncbi:hypothetical protein ACWXIC_000593 [Acinetobacter baumannii]